MSPASLLSGGRRLGLPTDEAGLARYAMLAVAAMHTHEVLDDTVAACFTACIAKWGYLFRFHPMWNHVSPATPHRGVISRLALRLNTESNRCLSRDAYGYRDTVDFRTELAGLHAWYSTSRGATSATRLGLAQLVAAQLAQQEVKPGERVPSPVGGGRLGAVDDTTRPCPAAPGITATDAMSLAYRNVLAEVVVDGLLANQRLCGLPKGRCYT